MRFIKEGIIMGLIILFVVIIEIITVNVTQNSLKEIDEKIAELEEVIDDNSKYEKVNELSELWKNKEIKLEFYMEHNELEAISSKMSTIKSNIYNNNMVDAIEQINEVKFRVEHIRNKQKLKLENIF
jgi:uncharacterized Zn finger protein